MTARWAPTAESTARASAAETAYGTTPVYTGPTPTKAETQAFTYRFDGWTPAVTAATKDATYTATFARKAKPQDWQSVTIRDRIYIQFLLSPRENFACVTIEYIGQDGVLQTRSYTDVSTLDFYDGFYHIPVEIAPAQIGDTIRATITADGETTSYSTSVAAYCRYLLDGDFEDSVKALAAATLAYGQAARYAFDYHTDVTIDEHFDELDKSAVLEYDGAVFSDGTGKITGAAFMALSKPEFRFYTADIDEQTAIAYNKAGVSAVMEGGADSLNARFVKTANGAVLLEVTGVSAENMDKTITVNITGLGTITFNGNAFARAMARSGSETQQNLGAALYNYGVAANACFR